MVQIPDFILFLYESFRKFFRIEAISNTNVGTGIDVSTQAFEATFYEIHTQQLSGNTRREMGTSAVSNPSKSGNIRSEAQKSANQRSSNMIKPSRLPIHIRHHKIQSS